MARATGAGIAGAAIMATTAACVIGIAVIFLTGYIFGWW